LHKTKIVFHSPAVFSAIAPSLPPVSGPRLRCGAKSMVKEILAFQGSRLALKKFDHICSGFISEVSDFRFSMLSVRLSGTVV